MLRRRGMTSWEQVPVKTLNKLKEASRTSGTGLCITWRVRRFKLVRLIHVLL